MQRNLHVTPRTRIASNTTFARRTIKRQAYTLRALINQPDPAW